MHSLFRVEISRKPLLGGFMIILGGVFVVWDQLASAI